MESESGVRIIRVLSGVGIVFLNILESELESKISKQIGSESELERERERVFFYLHQIFRYIAVMTKHNGFYQVKLHKLINNNKQFILNQNALQRYDAEVGRDRKSFNHYSLAYLKVSQGTI